MKGISYCGACADYDFKKHRCKRGAKKESNPQDKFFDDCPLPNVEQIVRCRDCKHFREYITGGTVCTKDAELLGGREVGMRATGKDDFCSYGEMKDDDEF